MMSSTVAPAMPRDANPKDAADKMVKWFELPAAVHGNEKIHVVVRLKHRADIRRTPISIQVKHRRSKEAMRKFRTIPTFLKAFVHADHRFRTQELIDNTRKQWGYDCQHTAGTVPKVNPRLHEQSCGTPPEVYAFLREQWKLKVADYDPCPLNYKVCGLSNKWPQQKENETVYINPPYRDCERWVKKTLRELRRGRIHSAAMLLPARLYPQWFHKWVIPYASKLTAAHGGIQFVGYDRVYPWGNIVVLLKRERVLERHRLLKEGKPITRCARLCSHRFHPAKATKRKQPVPVPKKKKKKKTKTKKKSSGGWFNGPDIQGLP